MSHTLLRCCVLLMLLGMGVYGVRPAHAARVTCDNPAMSAISFGSVDPQSTQTDVTATFNVTCKNTGVAFNRSATICLSIGSPRQMTNGSATLDFQLYKDPSRSIIWGSQFEGSATALQFDVEDIPYGGAPVPFSKTMYGRVLGGQTAVITGAYTKSYGSGNEARMTVNGDLTGNTPPGVCNPSPSGKLYFPFEVSATVEKKCTISASPLDFGTNPGLLTAELNASTILGVQCSIGTAYNVGLDAGQNGGGDINARKMLLGGNTVSYQLYRDLARTQVWGDTIGTNTVPGIGDGTTTQTLTVHGSVPPQTTPPAGTYKDTVVVTVTY